MRFLIPLSFCLLFACAEHKETIERVDVDTTLEELPQNQDIIVVKAKIIVQETKNKAGRVLEGVQDYYLQYKGDQHFIKFSESKIGPDDLKDHIGKTLEFRLIEREGLWDTDNPEVQSRVGNYVAVVELIGR